MKKKTLGVDSQGIQKTMRTSHYFGDGISQLALNTIAGLVSMLTYFYTDKIGIAAGVAGTIILIAKIIDAFTDLVMGKIVDNTKSKYGKVRPWFLWMIIPTIVAVVALFTVPAGASSSIKNAYALGSNIFATAIVYTAIAIPYGCMMSIRTKSVEERGKMGIFRAVFGYISGMIIAIGLIPITNMLGGDQKAWIIVAVIFAALSGISLYITFITSKEENSGVAIIQEDDENVSFKDSIIILFKNKYWVIMAITMFIINIIYALSAATGVYYTKYILGNENLVAILGGVGLIPVFLGFAITGPMIRKFGLAKTTRIAFIVGIIGSIIRVINPYSFAITLVGGSLVTFSTIPMMAIGGVLVNNTIEYNEWKFGKRLVGMSNSASSFGAKVGSGFGAAMIGWILAVGKYDGSMAVQSDSAMTSILILSIYLPLILLIIIYFIMRKYDLDLKYPQIVKELEEGKKNK